MRRFHQASPLTRVFRIFLGSRAFRIVRSPKFLTILLIGLVAPTCISIVFAATSPWTQTDWSGGSGQTSWSSSTQFDSSSNVKVSTANEITLSTSANWYNSSWKYRKNIAFDNSAQAENLTNVPVLVKLTSTNFDFTKAQSGGQDIRFTDSDGTTALSYEIEKWDNSGQTAWVWVKVPQVNASSTTDNIYVYYGNAAASDGQSVTGTWHSSYTSVWHLKETGNGTASEYLDSTTNALSGQGGGGTLSSVPSASTSGKIGNSQYFANDDYILIPSESSFDFDNTTFAVSGWIKTTANTQMVLTKNSNGSSGGWLVDISGNKIRGTIKGSAGGSAAVRSSSTSINNGAWHYFNIVFTTDTTTSASNDVLVYVDGVLDQGSITRDGTLYGSVSTAVNIGRRGGATAYLTGDLDDIRVSNATRSASWVAAQYKMGIDTYNTFTAEEAQVLTPGTLTSSIYDTQQSSAWGVLTYAVTTPANTTASVKVRTSDSASMAGATAFSSCTAISSGSDISANSCVGDSQRYVQYQVTLTNTNATSTPTFTSFSLAFAETAPAVTYYFDSVNGSDSAAGTSEGTAWKTLSKFNSTTFAAGETIRFKRGGIWDGGLTITESGSSGQRITISDYGTGTKPIFRDTSGDTYQRALEISGSYITIENIKVDDAATAAIEMFENANNNIIRNSDFSNVGIGITVKGDGSTITNNTFSDLKMVRNTVGGSDDYGALAVNLNADSQTDKQISNTTISYNNVLRAKAPSYDYGNDGGFVEIFGGMDNITINGNIIRDSKGFIEIGSAPSQNNNVANVYIYNNVAFNNGLFMFVNSGLYAATIDNIVVQNNTIYDSSSTSSQFFFDNGAPTSSQFILRNNILYGRAQFVNCNNVPGVSGVGCGSSAGTFTHTNNIYKRVTGSQVGYTLHASEQSVDAILVSTGSGDLRIRPASPAIGAGYATGYSEDFNRTARPQGSAIDIGAYEFSVASAPASLVTYQSNGTTVLSTGSWYNQNSVVTKFNVSGYDPQDSFTPKVEVKTLGSTFDGTSLTAGSVVAASGSAVQATVSLSNLADGQYHWRASSTNIVGTSAYSVYGGNAESERDFGIDVTLPTASSISINAGATSTTSSSVAITLSATDATSGVSDMIVSESSSFVGASWETYSTSKAFALSSGAGTKTVYVKFRDAAGNESSTISDSITYTIVNSAPSTPTLLGPAAFVDGSFDNDPTPTLSFSLSDADSSDTVSYRVQIDDSSDFGSLLVDYTATLSAQGSMSFTVGQAVGLGVYTTGTAGQTLTNGNYYWRVKAIDPSAAESSFATANSGAIAFKIDLTAPSAPASLSSATPSLTGINATWSAVTDGLSGLSHYVWTILTSVGGEVDNGVTSSLTYVRALAEGVYTFLVSAVDNAGNSSTQSSVQVIVDYANPIISSVSSAVNSSTSATLTWTTDDTTTSRVRYGIGSTSALATSQTDTSPRVTSHSVSLSSLSACATYDYVVESIDVASKIATSSAASFTTTGCLGSASVVDQDEAPVSQSSGGTSTLSFSGGDVELTAPAATAVVDTTFQIKRIGTDAVIAAAPFASSSSVVSGYTFDFSALTATGSAVHLFDEPVDIVIGYSSTVASNYDVTTLFIATWTGTEWSPLSDCSVNTTTREVSCSTTHFSTFGLFGTEQTPTPTPSPSSNNSSSGSSSSGSSNSSSPSGPCTEQAPTQAPYLYEIRRMGAGAELYFTPVQPMTQYTVEYGNKANEFLYGFSWDATQTGGAVKVNVNHLDPQKFYTFRVRGSNRCAPGRWSNELTIGVSRNRLMQFFPGKVVAPLANQLSRAQKKVTQSSTQDVSKPQVIAPSAPSVPAPSQPTTPSVTPIVQPSAPVQPQAPVAPAPAAQKGFVGWVKKILKW